MIIKDNPVVGIKKKMAHNQIMCVNNVWFQFADFSQPMPFNARIIYNTERTLQPREVGFIKGSSDPGEILTVGPGSLVELPGDGEIGFVSQKAEIQAVVNAIDKLVKWTCVSQGLSAAAVTTDISEASGISKFYDSQELSEMRVEDKILWSAYEKKLFNLMRIIHNTHSTDKFSNSAQLKVNFADPSRPAQSPLDEAEAYKFYYDMGVMSPVDIIMQRDKDLRSREEAFERLKQIQFETDQLAPQ